MRVHAHESEVLVQDIKRNNFIVGRAECSLSLPQGFAHSKCLADDGKNWLGALSYLLSHVVKR